jgi:hypothetical protein
VISRTNDRLNELQEEIVVSLTRDHGAADDPLMFEIQRELIQILGVKS